MRMAFRRLLAVLLTAAGLFGGTAVTAPTAGALGWGAIAISPGAGRVGYSKGLNSAIDAERAAIGLCQARDCRAVVNFTNACGAVAQSSNTYWAWGRHRSAAGAQRSALISCTQLGPGCRVVGWVCS
ncbi:DUF4189 domain-containing protein [Mycolicibacterium sp. 120270]|uniref:DUF4189 domain-containing protein n=1 Tax=Mycolicibacterium sp. 120270 TaxID=3090600 RepID=UPI00299E71DD|nr:DUF4189 domain-containing protein [Mycolicibacterium sp. 120270]MDX1882211.1 DUF4189 domain-containing protein [Mycolicibacterium sp. 120270]